MTVSESQKLFMSPDKCIIEEYIEQKLSRLLEINYNNRFPAAHIEEAIKALYLERTLNSQ